MDRKYKIYRTSLWVFIAIVVFNFLFSNLFLTLAMSGAPGLSALHSIVSILFGLVLFLSAVIIFIGGGHPAPNNISWYSRKIYRVITAFIFVSTALLLLFGYVSSIFNPNIWQEAGVLSIILGALNGLLFALVFITALLLLIKDRHTSIQSPGAVTPQETV